MGKTYADGRKRHRSAPQWTREQLLERLREWVRLYGRPPRYEEWRKGERYESGDWPSTMPVIREFGNWPGFLRAGGYEPYKPERWPVPEKSCAGCGVRLERRPDEKRWSFRRRRFCTTRCAGMTSAGDAFRERAVRYIELRREGLLNIEIAEREGVSRHAVAMVFVHARRIGLDVPSSPYWSRGVSSRA